MNMIVEITLKQRWENEQKQPENKSKDFVVTRIEKLLTSIHISTCFRFSSKTYANVAQIISSLFILIDHMVTFSEYVFEKHELPSILMKNIKCCTNNYVISYVKKFSSHAFLGWSCAFNFRIWFGKQKNDVSAKMLN